MRLAQPPGSSGHGPVGSPRLSIRTRRAALGVQVISEDDFRRHPGRLGPDHLPRADHAGTTDPDQHAISALPRVHPARSSDGSTVSAVTHCITTCEPVLCCAAVRQHNAGTGSSDCSWYRRP